MKKWLALGAVSLLALAGCSSGEYDTTGIRVGGNSVLVYDVPLPDGGSVLCIISAGAKGISCDW